ncbi:MurR/RpiR family transcriptional regulator [Alteribacillus sp. JSM 102045]|uniref:MurR/RpiR family transcriptional regulator n=1 Tax=Alteribacillus sp. JSM 102045 TaxID=1562101 RepID=UPI0035C23D45
MYNFVAKLLNFIESSIDQASTDIVIAEYILKNVHQIPDMSIHELAHACHTSPATVTRFCRKFDNVSFKELKEYARTFNEFNSSEVDYQEIEKNVNHNEIANYFEHAQVSLNETLKLLDSKSLFSIAAKIHRSKKISFFGVTFSHVIARNAQFKFLRLGKHALSYSNHENQLSEAESQSEDLAFIISFSGNTRFITRLTKVLTRQRTPIIAVTSDPHSFLAQRATDIIQVSSQKLKTYKSPLVEELSLQSAINSLYLVYSTYLHRLENSK